MKRRASDLTAAELRERLDYDPATGVFHWKMMPGWNRRIGRVAGFLHHDGYWIIKINDLKYYAHQLAWLYMTGKWSSGEIDHKDNVRSHNWFANLRPATKSQNLANAKRYKSNTSGFKGVRLHTQELRWEARITKNGRRYCLGLYDDPAEAHTAYLAKARKLFGEYTRPG